MIVFSKVIRRLHLLVRGKGAYSTLEASIVVPVVLLITIGAMVAFTLTYKYENKYLSTLISTREESSTWFDKKSLYEEYVYDYEVNEQVKVKLKNVEGKRNFYLLPNFNGSDKSIMKYDNYLFLRFIKNKERNIEKENTPLSMFVRNINVSNEMIEDALNAINDQEKEDEEVKNVYVVDEKLDELLYNRVYHTKIDCRYVKDNEYLVIDKKEALKDKFRPCMICINMGK